MAFRIPKQREEAVKKLLELKSDQRELLIKVLEQASVVRSEPELLGQVCDAMKLEDNGELLREVLKGLLNLEFGRNVRQKSPEVFSRDVCQAARNQELGPQDADWSTIETQLTRLFSCRQSIGTLSKAFAIIQEDERLFMGSRIVSDLRPVFEDDPKTAPASTLVTHRLKIDYREAGVWKEFYVALDRTDLEKLREIVERAIHKERTLEQLAERMNMRILSVSDED